MNRENLSFEQFKLEFFNIGFQKDKSPPGIRRLSQLKTKLTDNLYNFLINQLNTNKFKNIFEIIWLIINKNSLEKPKCKICNNDAIYKSYKQGFSNTCESKQCIKKWKTGAFDRALNKYLKSNKINNANKINNFSQIESIKKIRSEKMKINAPKYNKIFFEKYNVKSPMQVQKFKDKFKKLFIEKYGVDNPMKVQEIKNKGIEKNLNKYNVKNYNQRNLKNYDKLYDRDFIIKNFINNKIFNIRKFIVYFDYKGSRPKSIFIDYFKKINIIDYIDINKTFTKSSYEIEIREFIKSIINTEIKNNYILKFNENNIKNNIKNNIELDIYIPEKNLAIEFDGLFWHSQGKIYINEGHRKYNTFDRHLKKTEACESKNINLLHIFENEWLNPRTKEIWKSVISYKLGVTKEKYFARKLEIKEIKNKKLVREFFNKNHLQGGDSPAKIAIGLYNNNELISCMTFAKPRFNKNYEYELIRFASKKFTSCVGCAQRLFKHFLKEFQPKSVISYANRRWASSLSNLYKSIGFRYLRTAEPNYFYFQLEDPNLRLWPRVKFQKHKLKNLNLSGYNPSKTETEIMFDSGFRRIYDSGNLVYDIDLK